MHASAPMQVIVAQLLKHWGVCGFLHHVDRVATMYEARRNKFVESLNTIMGGERRIAKWTQPVAGMFFWLKLHLPPTATAPEGDSFQVVSEKGINNNVLVVPGTSFFAGGRTTPYVRLSFSVIPEHEMAEGLRRLRSTIESAWREAGYDAIPPMP